MKASLIYTSISMILGMLLADALYARSVQSDLLAECASTASYDKSGDMICPQILARNEQ